MAYEFVDETPAGRYKFVDDQEGRSADYKKGRKESSPVLRGVNSALSGPTFGFWDELAGAISAPVKTLQNGKSLGENYRAARDYVRGIQDQYKEDFPVGSVLTQAAASAPLGAVGRLARPMFGATQAAPILSGGKTIANAAVSGGISGALGGAGDSTEEDLMGVGKDALWGGIKGAGTAGGLSAVSQGGGAMFRTGNALLRPNSDGARNYAQAKVAEAIARDARGDLFTQGTANPVNQAAARLNKLGSEARVVDAAGQNTRQLLDTLSTLPGRTKDATEAAIRSRQAGRGDRLWSDANAALGTNWRDVGETLTRLDTQRKTAAQPFYDVLQGVSVSVDDDVARLLTQTRGIHGEAEKLWRLQTGQDLNLGSLTKGQQVPFQVLDTLKQSLYDAASAAKRQGSNKMGLALDDVRQSLTNKLDDLAPKTQTGESVYRLAREAYAGPSQLMDAAEIGTTAMTAPLSALRESMRGMTASERDAFRVGALQSLMEKTGTQSGQTSITKMWMERNTQDRLRLIFDNDYRAFAAAVAKETRLKGLDSVGRGSQTASRLYGAGDLDVSPIADAGQLIGGIGSGSPTPILTGAVNLWNRVKTPEPVRDAMGQMLLSQGQQGRRVLNNLAPTINRINTSRARQSALFGLYGDDAFNGAYGGLLAP